MSHSLLKKLPGLVCIAALAASLSACNALQLMSEVGSGPQLSAVTNPQEARDYRPVSMPMPTPEASLPAPNSLWRPGARAFFKDQRASEIGDILTVVVNVSGERAQLTNQTSRSRGNSENAGLPAFLGAEANLGNFLPDAVNPANLVGLSSDSSHSGTGSIQREETINLRLAAVVLQILPNGNLVIAGRQEMRVNTELRELAVTGVIRPQDIRSDNTINWDKIAEARISYGGRGTISDVQQPRYGQQIFDIIFPF